MHQRSLHLGTAEITKQGSRVRAVDASFYCCSFLLLFVLIRYSERKLSSQTAYHEIFGGVFYAILKFFSFELSEKWEKSGI